MVDLHTHILFGMDDGAADVSESRKLIELQKKNGIKKIALTSHFYSYKESAEEFLKRREEKFILFSEIFKNLSIEFKTASEVYISSNLLNIEDLSSLCYKDTNYMLLELPFTGPFKEKLFNTVEKLIFNKNIIPVIAHAERYEAIQNDLSILDKFNEMGCVIQMNASAIIEKSSRRFSLRLIENNKIHVIASDCHNLRNRQPNTLEAFKIIEKKLGSIYCKTLNENAHKIFNGEKLHNADEESMIIF